MVPGSGPSPQPLPRNGARDLRAAASGRRHAGVLVPSPVLLEAAAAGYDQDMARFALPQADLFAPAPATPSALRPDPLDELTALLDRLRAADRLPWPDAAAAMAEERHALGLASLAGPEGEQLAADILQETERLLALEVRPA